MKKRKANNLPVKLVFGLVTLTLVLFLAIGYLAGALKRTDFFNIKGIIIREGENRDFSADLSYLKGRNILTIDLKKEEQSISQIYPGYKKIKLIRLLPDRLFADFLRRKPVAYIKLSRYFCVDADGVLLEPLASGEPDLPVIYGLETKIFGPKQGEKYNTRGLIVAINIIKTIKSNKTLKDLQIKKIDVIDPANASFLIFVPNPAFAGNLQIKIGQEHIDDKINILSSVFIQAKNDWGNIKYIDLRFKEPVIKFK